MWGRQGLLRRTTWLPALNLAVGLLIPSLLGAQEPVFKMGELTEQPKIADAKQARRAILSSYSAALQRAGVEGAVEVAFILNADGTVDSPSITVISSPDAGLSEAAVVALRKLLFQPGLKDGRPVRCEVLMPIRYSLGDGSGASG